MNFYYTTTTTDDLLFSMENITENILNDKNQHKYHLRYPQLSGLTYTIVFGFICACLCFLTIAGNLLVLITFRHVRTVGNLFILSLATADLIVGCFVMPLAGIYAIMEEWKMGLVLCRIWMSVDFTASTASIFNLLTLSLDRYWSITSPLQYLGKRTRTRALLLIGFAWGLSLLWVIPIFGWQYFFKDEKTSIDENKCEPEYSHSKIFKVTTAILNFYFPLLVLICLNARIYYEIKRRYKNVLLQQHSNQIRESNINNLYNRKRKYQGKNCSSSITTILGDNNERQMCSITNNYSENDSLFLSKISSKLPENESIIRINLKEKIDRTTIPIHQLENPNNSLKRAYSFVEKNHSISDGITWLNHSRKHSHSSYSPTSSAILSNYPIHRQYNNENYLSNSNEYHSHKSRIKSNSINSNHRYDISSSCRHCSILNTEETTNSIPYTSPSTIMNMFNFCHCCSTSTSTITINSNSYINNPTSSTIESYIQKRAISTSSSSSVTTSIINQKKYQSIISSRSPNSSTSSSLMHSKSLNQIFHTKQSTIWNQQEKAFRQLFAIVFGFTCCFLPYFILYMVIAYCDTCVSERVVTASIWLGYVNSTINPFLYALSNKHFRRTFKRLIKRNNHRQSFYN